MTDTFLDLTKKAIETTGFPLEERVARKFRDAGFEVIQSAYYTDVTTSKTREVDILATASALYKDENYQDFSIILEFYVIVECKHNDKKKSAWVVFSREEKKRSFFMNYFISQEKEQERNPASLMSVISKLISKKDFKLLKIDGMVGNQYKFVKIQQSNEGQPNNSSRNGKGPSTNNDNDDNNNKDFIFNATEKIVSSLSYYNKRFRDDLLELIKRSDNKKRINEIRIKIHIPVIVIYEGLVKCTFDQNSSVHVEESEKELIVIIGQDEIKDTEPRPVWIVVESHLPDFTKQLYDDIKLILQDKESLNSIAQYLYNDVFNLNTEIPF